MRIQNRIRWTEEEISLLETLYLEGDLTAFEIQGNSLPNR